MSIHFLSSFQTLSTVLHKERLIFPRMQLEMRGPKIVCFPSNVHRWPVDFHSFSPFSLRDQIITKRYHLVSSESSKQLPALQGGSQCQKCIQRSQLTYRLMLNSL